MKSFKIKQIVMTICLSLVIASSAFAKTPKHKATPEAKDSITYSSSSSSSNSETATHSDPRFAIGYAFAENFTGAASSVTGILKLTDRDLVQGYFAIPATSPFLLSMGGNYKRTIAESQNAGFHVGGGVSFGSLQSPTKAGTAFFFAVDALAGLHFNLSGAPHIQIHVDGGPVFSVTDGSSNFHVGAASAQLGAALVYWL